jgi:hypothetical protein
MSPSDSLKDDRPKNDRPKDERLKDDRLTLIAISALACILGDVLHEGLGHGVTAWLSGAHRLTVSTVALQSDVDTRWISANGTLVNLFFGAVFYLLLRRPQHYRPAVRYFLVLAMTGNLFSGTGYFLFSGVANFGDWADVIHGLQPYWMWRVALVVLGFVSYYGAMLLVAAELRAFAGQASNPHRIRDLCWTPYFADGLLAALGGLLNPMGLFYVIASALPSTLGANAGLISLPFILPYMMRNRRPSDHEPVALIERSPLWIAIAAAACLTFIFVLGRGITWQR